MNTPIPEPPVAFEPPPLPPKRALLWAWFTLALLLPPIITFATAAAGSKDFPIACPFVGGGLAGLICGILLGRRLGKTTQAVILLSVVFTFVFGALSFALCFGGCLLGNYNLDVR